MFNNKHENYFVYKIYSHWCLYTCMLYRSSIMHLFVYIPTNVTWFSDVNIDTKTIIYPPFCSFFRIFVNLCCLVYQQPNTNARFFRLHFVVLLFFFCFTFVFHMPTASCWLTVCLSVVQILIIHVCSFFHTYTSCIQRLYKGQFKILQSYFGFHDKMSLAVQYKIFNTVRVHVHLSQVIP